MFEYGHANGGAHGSSDPALWSRDEDISDPVALDALIDDETTGRDALALTTDIPFDSPPRGVEQWNRENVGDFPSFDRDTSVHPPGVSLTDRRYVRDAYIEIFTAQPSTRAKLSPDDQPRYVAPTGSLLAVSDYRVRIPEDSVTETERTYWNLTGHDVTETRLLVDGEEEARNDGNRRPRFEYDFGDNVGIDHTLTVESTITVTVGRLHERCVPTPPDDECSYWITSFENQTSEVTVRDSISVTEYYLDIMGFHARYPDGDLGTVVIKSDPWLGYSLPTGDVRGVWRFYSARDPTWDTLVSASASGSSRSHSPVHPLRVFAYPIKTGPTVSPAEKVELLMVNGGQRQPPTLPGAVDLDVLEEPYTESFSIATRIDTPAQDISDVTAHGLVRGVETSADPRLFEEVAIHRSNLSLSVLNTTATTASVRVSLRDVETDTPIETADREGRIVLAGKEVQTGRDGTLTTTISRPSGAIGARYEPGEWWLSTTAYVGDSDAVSVDGTTLSILGSLYRAGVPVGLFLLAVFLIDRVTGMAIWPPWRGL
ncbi:hypothetical protein HZS55_06410 [Halosimplex rubrum]|uniref:Uncharacterized protein n=1 Tax=Halosimplex rubrum TaxID=869889 RepID=A0A7D5SZA3_9EURY|nr:hypothetical protein [Halosimplex rubrum]QLH76948.1 hypothetical protein HZS55_06410 [Halosimplex rubrum]